MAEDPEVIFGRWLVALKRAVENPGKTLKRIGVLITSRIQRRFTEQKSPEGGGWAERMTPNIPGILSDLERGAAVKQRRWQPKPVLLDNGGLRQSIAWRIEGTDTTVIGTVLDYAKVHQFGLERIIPITPTMKAGIKEMLSKFHRKVKRAKGKPVANDASRLAFLLHRDIFAFKVVARPFIGISDEDQADIYEIIRGNFLKDALGEAGL